MSEALVGGIIVFVLATYLGASLIGRVPPTLHTPLMSGSNAVSGITIVGAILVAGAGFVLVRRGGIAGLRPGAGWPRPGTSNAGRPVSLGRTALTQQASVHVIEWKGEELLLGCTSHSVALLARAPAAPTASGKTGDGAGAGT